MRVARQLHHHLDQWRMTWQQVETFLDRIDAARDQDGSARRKLEGLLGAAAVVERHGRAVSPGQALGAPVIGAMPTQTINPDDPDGPALGIGDPWSTTNRRARLPGMDELELAANSISATDPLGLPIEILTSVRLVGERTIFSRPDDESGALIPIRLPSYTGDDTARGASIVGAATIFVDISADSDEEADSASLFSIGRRVTATMGTDPDNEQVQSWGAVAMLRRVLRAADTPVPVDPPSAAGTAAALATKAADTVAALRTGALSGPAVGLALADLVASAQAAPSSADPDAELLAAAADALDDEGAANLSLAGDLRAISTSITQVPLSLPQFRAALVTLAEQPFSAPAQNAVLHTGATLAIPPSAALLLGLPVELGPLRPEIDQAVAARLAYPDGSLRMVRTMEAAFLAVWRDWLRWFRLRNEAILEPLVARFRQPFIASLGALLDGGDTGLLAVGLTLGPHVTVGAGQVVTAQPASILPALDDVEPGQVGVIAGDRPAALLILGLDEAAGKLVLATSPLRVSVAAGPPGTPGVLIAAQAVGTIADGLSADELRAGESALGPAADGIVHETLAIWSRLCLVFGWPVVQTELRGTASYPGRAVPDPSPTPLETIGWHGSVPARATTLALLNLPAAFWDRSDPDDPLPLVARTGELLLLRGRLVPPPESSDPAPLVQAALEVDGVVRTTGSMLGQMDLAAVGLLSTQPVDAGALQSPVLMCGPEEEVVLITLRNNGMDADLVSDVTVRRDFGGFDLPSLATQRLLPLDLLDDILESPVPDPAPGVDRGREFQTALSMFTDWLRYATHG